LAERVVIATRGSKLALIQAEWVAGRLRELHRGVEFAIEIIKTAGDKVQSAPFAQVGAMGVFVREIENALADGRADVAVHSLKDLQTELHPALEIGAMPERESARDALISRDGAVFAKLRDGAIIGTSSARRRGIIAAEGRGFEIRECRGNVPTRIEKLRRGEYDAVILAEAGLRRMGMESGITEYLDIEQFVPAVGQGALGIEIRKNDERISGLVKPLNDEKTYIACTEERAFLAAIGGGCHAPVGGYMHFDNGQAVFHAFAGTCDVSWAIRKKLCVKMNDAEGIGLRMAEEIRNSPGSGAFFEEAARDAC